ncbi:MAG: hypothetical protein H6973_15010 [Gammaproteobacteria bacterium]|nr:hypothetical protein [Gammaproteobacteria bacterium]
MSIDEALREKYRVQTMLSESATDIHDYFQRSHEAAKRAMAEIGLSPNYASTPTIRGGLSERHGKDCVK